VPVAGTFYREGAFDSSSQSLKDFYDEYNRVINGRAEREPDGEGGRAEAKAFVSSRPRSGGCATGSRSRRRRQELEDVGDEVNGIYAAPRHEDVPAQKREALDRAYEKMVSIARQALGRAPLRAERRDPGDARVVRNSQRQVTLTHFRCRIGSLLSRCRVSKPGGFGARRCTASQASVRTHFLTHRRRPAVGVAHAR
jgi:hypothetical protein